MLKKKAVSQLPIVKKPMKLNHIDFQSEGVRVYILLYKEALGGFFLQLGSHFTMEELHDPPRINVCSNNNYRIALYTHVIGSPPST